MWSLGLVWPLGPVRLVRPLELLWPPQAGSDTDTEYVALPPDDKTGDPDYQP